MNNQQAAVGPRPGMGRMGPAVVIPKGVGAPPPPGMDPRRGKLMCIKVRMLDDSVGVFHLGHKALGQALFDEVCRHLNLLESDYFGLEFTDCYGNHCWLDKDKPILRQITATQSDARFYFIVKFYTPNPADLEEEYTRYLMALQIKRDLASGEMLCNENTAALLASYIVQSDCGDFSMDDYPDSSYLSSGRFLPNQSLDFQNRVRENHMKLIGMSPGESDLSLLETARRSDFYGVKLHAAKDVEGTDVCLTVAHLGIRVFHQLQCVSTFSWAKIRKLSFKRRKLLIKLHPESYQYYKETIEFSFEGRNECKCFWKKCVEHHAFFRCSEVNSAKKSKEARLFSKGSSFRFHGRTQKQLIDYVREHHKRREPFTRPIRPGLSSRSDRLSRPAQLNMSTAYSTVSERAINVVTGIPSSSCSQQQATSRRQSGGVAGGGVSRATGGGSMPHINGQSHPHVSDATDSKSDVEYSRIRAPRLAIQGVNSTFSNPDICVVSPLEMNFRFSESAGSRLDGRTITRLRGAESSDSGALTFNDGDTSPVRLTNTAGSRSAFKPYSRSDSGGENSEFGALKSVSEAVTEPDDASPTKVRTPNSKSYHILKEMMMIERTTTFDLKILTNDFHKIFPEQLIASGRALSEFFLTMKPLHDFHRNLLIDLENKLSNWENLSDSPSKPTQSDQARVGDLLLCAVHNALHHYRCFVMQMPIFLGAIDELSRTNPTFNKALKSLEDEPCCYLPINLLMIKTTYRMVVWQNILGRMVAVLLEEGGASVSASQLSNSRVALDKVASFNAETRATREGLTNFVKLVELENDFNGSNSLLQPNRKFLRQGWLSKWSSKGLVPRIFILFNDSILFAQRAHPNHFVVNGCLPVRAMLYEDGDAYHVTADSSTCITLYGGNRSLVLSANSTATKELWLEEITNAIRIAKETKLEQLPRNSNIKPSASNDDLTTESLTNGIANTSLNPDTSTQNANTVDDKCNTGTCKTTTLQVCWHRQATLGIDSLLAAPANQLSGYLWRKFRNSAGWQKLWVVHANFTLFFYKTHQDWSPLANLPLIDYQVSLPALSDQINKENVFKLCYKAHFYFFRVESNYAFIRWIESIRQASLNACPFDALTALVSRFS